MYKVPLDIPKYCNKCPFGVCKFAFPFWAKEKPNTMGYYCNIRVINKEKIKILTSTFDGNIKRPKECPLKEVKE